MWYTAWQTRLTAMSFVFFCSFACFVCYVVARSLMHRTHQQRICPPRQQQHHHSTPEKKKEATSTPNPLPPRAGPCGRGVVRSYPNWIDTGLDVVVVEGNLIKNIPKDIIDYHRAKRNHCTHRTKRNHRTKRYHPYRKISLYGKKSLSHQDVVVKDIWDVAEIESILQRIDRKNQSIRNATLESSSSSSTISMNRYYEELIQRINR